MTPARALALMAAVLGGLGFFLLRLALAEPEAVIAATTVRGALVRTERRPIPGEGEAFVLHLEGQPAPVGIIERFERRPALLNELQARLAPNASVVAWVAEDPERRLDRVSRLDVNGFLIYVADEDQGGALGLLHAGLGVAGLAALGAGLVTARAARGAGRLGSPAAGDFRHRA